MKILSLNHSDMNGGAARASFRIFEALHKNGTAIEMLVKHKGSSHENVLETSDFYSRGIAGQIDALRTKIENRVYKKKIKKYDQRKDAFVSNLSSISLKVAFRKIDFDILHLHWISHQFLNLEELKDIKKPIVWTLHDCWAFTGICHYFDHCDNYTRSCGSCFLLNSNKENDLSREVWRKKFTVYEQCDIHVVTPSKWLGNSASQSALFRKFPVSVIPYPINTEKFKPADKPSARKKLGLETNKKYILFGAMNALDDFRKGFHFVKKAFKLFPAEENSDTELLVFGAQANELNSINGYRVKTINNIEDDAKLVELFSIADVVIVPSISENLSLVIMESLACGTPVVAFDIGGNSDMIEHKKNGYLVTPYSVEDMSNGIQWCLKQAESSQLSAYARKKVIENFSENIVSEKYQGLYRNLV